MDYLKNNIAAWLGFGCQDGVKHPMNNQSDTSTQLLDDLYWFDMIK